MVIKGDTRSLDNGSCEFLHMRAFHWCTLTITEDLLRTPSPKQPRMHLYSLQDLCVLLHFLRVCIDHSCKVLEPGGRQGLGFRVSGWYDKLVEPAIVEAMCTLGLGDFDKHFREFLSKLRSLCALSPMYRL